MIKKLASDRTLGGRSVLALAVVAIICAVTACGSSSSHSESPGQGSNQSSGGSPKLTGTPIKIGFLSYTLGPSPISSAGPGEQAALSRTNNHMDGINGHPVDADVCQVDATPETNITCANKFVRDKVVAVVDGFDPGSGAVLPILHSAQIPLVGALAYSSQADSDQQSFYFAAGQAEFGIGSLKSFKDQGLSKVAFAQRDEPASHAYFEKFVAPAARGLGLNFSPVYFPQQSPNFQVIASTLASTGADVAGSAGMSGTGQCSDLVNGLRSVGYTKAIFAGFCTFRPGTDIAGVEEYSSVWLPQMKRYAPTAVQNQLEMAQGDISALGGSSSDAGYYTYATYATIMNLASALRKVTATVDGPAVSAALQASKNVASFLGPTVSCDHSVWPHASTCSNALVVAQFQSDGSLKPVGGGFEVISPSLLPTP